MLVVLSGDLVVGVVVDDGRVLVVRNEGFGFPSAVPVGGESGAEAIGRVLREDFGLDVDVRLDDFFFRSGSLGVDGALSVHAYLVRLVGSGDRVYESVDYLWVPFGELFGLGWDLSLLPVVESLRGLLEVDE